MKKVTLVCLADDRSRTLEALRDLGVLHLAHIKEPESADLDKTRGELHRAQSALNLMGFNLSRKDNGTSNADSESRIVAAGGAAENRSGQPAQEIVNSVHDLISRKKELAEKLESLHSEKAAIEPFGNFDPALIEQLAKKGIIVKLYHWRSRKPVVPPEGTTLLVLKQDSIGQHIAIAGREEFTFAATEIPLPRRSLEEVLAELETAKADFEKIETQLREFSTSFETVVNHVSDLAERVKYLQARDGMGTDRKLAYLQGFCPFNVVDQIRASVAEHGWGLAISDPSETDRVPTLIRNPAWIRIIEPLFHMLKILPGYHEVDVSPSFLVFLSIFFAMIVGDAGYGLMFLALTLFGRFKMKKAPREPFNLMTLFSVCTIIWGILSGSYFGIVSASAPLRRLRIEWLQSRENVMNLCLFLGALHLSIAHIWNAVRMINSTRAIAQLGWICITWTMYFAAKAMIVGSAFPQWSIPVAVGGLIAVIVFMTPLSKFKSEWVYHAILPQTIMSTFGDILSYLRLFALGIASLELAGAFNTIASRIGFSGVLQGLGSAIILFLGHGLNVVLSALSVLVHGIRLNALEFSTHLGLEWSGFRYEPFVQNKGREIKR